MGKKSMNTLSKKNKGVASILQINKSSYYYTIATCMLDSIVLLMRIVFFVIFKRKPQELSILKTVVVITN